MVQVFTSLTERQRKLYEEILKAAQAGKVCPTNREIAASSGLVSASAVADALGRLQRKGVVEVKRYSRARVVVFPAVGVSTGEPPELLRGKSVRHWSERRLREKQRLGLSGSGIGRTKPAHLRAPGGQKELPGDCVRAKRTKPNGCENKQTSQPDCFSSKRANREAEKRAGKLWQPKTCQFFEGEPRLGEEVKCGKPVKRGSSYCSRHHARCYIPAQSCKDYGELLEIETSELLEAIDWPQEF